MDTNKCKFYFSLRNETVLVKIDGLPSMNNSYPFKDFADQMIAQGYRKFVIDLTHCHGMDSTFMGIMIGIVNHDEKGAQVTVTNPNRRCRNVMRSLGITALIKLQDKPLDINTKWQLISEGSANPDKIEFIKKVHKQLAALNEENQKRFGPFLNEAEEHHKTSMDKNTTSCPPRQS